MQRSDSSTIIHENKKDDGGRRSGTDDCTCLKRGHRSGSDTAVVDWEIAIKPRGP